MGRSTDYSDVPDWVSKPEGYQKGAKVKYKGNIFYANFWASEPGTGDPDHNGWRFYDELYDLTPHTPTAQAKIIGYIPTWKKKEGFNYANDEMYRYITHGIIAFLMFSEANPGEFEPTALDDLRGVVEGIVTTGHRNGTRISIALGGGTDYGFLKLMTLIGLDPSGSLLERMVQNLVVFVSNYNLDGVDLDLECWWDRGDDPSKDQGGRLKAQGPHPAGYGLTLLAQKLKQAMPDKFVSVTLFGTSWYGNNYDPKIADYVDWLAIMTYDLTGSWNVSPVGPHTALYKNRSQESYIEEQQGEWPDPKHEHKGVENNPILSVEDTLWYWTNPIFVNWQQGGQSIPRSKVAAGVPLYGYDFAYAKGPGLTGYKTISYKDILKQFPGAHAAPSAHIKIAGSVDRPYFIDAPEKYPFSTNLYFETPDTAVAKLNFLKDVGAQGVIIWELTSEVWDEGKSLAKALYKNSGNPETRPAIPTLNKPSVTSDILAPFIERMRSYTNEFVAEIPQCQEKQTSQLGLLIEPGLEGAITKYFDDAGKANGKEIKVEDANNFKGQWRAVAEEAKRYQVGSSEAPTLITDLKNKIGQLVSQVELKIQGEDGWLFVPFYLLIALFKTHVSLERFVRQNPCPIALIPPPIPIPIPPPIPIPIPPPPPVPPVPDPGSGNSESKKKECEREADEVSQEIELTISVLTGALAAWPTMDLGLVGTVLGIPANQDPTKYQYHIKLSNAGILGFHVQFFTLDQEKEIAVFEGLSSFTFGLQATDGTATFNYDVELMARENWKAKVQFRPSAIGIEVHFVKVSGEEIGSLYASGNNNLGSGTGDGDGTFKLSFTPTLPPPATPLPGKYSYYVEVQVTAFLVYLQIHIQFLTLDRTRELATFYGDAGGSGTGKGLWRGTVEINYDVEWLVSQHKGADFQSDFAMAGIEVRFGEEIGSISLGGSNLITVGIVVGKGSFQSPWREGTQIR